MNISFHCEADIYTAGCVKLCPWSSFGFMAGASGYIITDFYCGSLHTRIYAHTHIELFSFTFKRVSSLKGYILESPVVEVAQITYETDLGLLKPSDYKLIAKFSI
jgi:hypothetical protein